jgi:hypothetical protein
MDDLMELERAFKKMGDVPTRFLTKAVKSEAQPLLLKTQMNAPIGETGNLLRAMVLISEKSKPGKRVMQITYDSAFNDRLAKTSKSGKRSYYPASQEYGFMLRNGIKKQGKRFMRNTADANAASFSGGIITYMMNKIETEWRK